MKELDREDMSLKVRRAGLAGLAIAFLSTAATAQFLQYLPPGSFRPQREDTQQILERNMETARWRAGRLLVDPWFGLRDIGYVDYPSSDQESDVTAAAGIGLRGWLPVGSELTLAAHALPEYVWWKDQSFRNRWNGRYGAGLFGNLGRTGMELTATRTENAQIFSRELETLVNTRRDVGALQLEFDLGRGFSLFGDAAYLVYDYLDDEGDEVARFNLADRDEQVYRLGVGFTLPRGLELGIGAEYSEVEFEPGLSDRSNTGTAPILQLDYVGPSLALTADLAYRDLEPTTPGSEFVDFQDVTGRAQLSWRTMGRLELQLFGARNLVYSISDTWSYYLDSWVGFGIRGALARWASARVFIQTGDNDYTPIELQPVVRVDDYDAWGGDLNFTFKRFQVLIGGTRTDYVSNLPGFDREVTTLRSSISFGVGGGMSWQ